MHRVARDDMVRYVEFFQQLLHGGDFVGFFVDLDMRQHQRRVDGERAEHLSCLDVIEAIETALERLAIERHDTRAETGPGPVQVGCMFAKDLFNIRRAQPLQNIPDRSVRGRPLPADLEGFVQLSSVDFDEGADAAIRVGAAHNRQNGKQQDVWQLIKFAFGPPRVGDCREERKETFERFQGNLRMIRSPHIDSELLVRRNPPFPVAHQIVKPCCIADSI